MPPFGYWDQDLALKSQKSASPGARLAKHDGWTIGAWCGRPGPFFLGIADMRVRRLLCRLGLRHLETVAFDKRDNVEKVDPRGDADENHRVRGTLRSSGDT